MPIISIQLNHPNVEKGFYSGCENEINSGFHVVENEIIREWNRDERHYRKFIRNKGTFIENIEDSVPKNDIVSFWGEWEGHSIFRKSDLGGIHEPFHSVFNRGIQNTDPYVFGDYFKYAICSQKGIMTDLEPGSMILFGTTKKEGFVLDTVFVVKSWETAKTVNSNNTINYTQTYKEETLEQLGDIYLGKNPSNKNRIYRSQTWEDNRNFFSYVPCKLDSVISENKFNKVVIPTPPLANQKVGHPYRKLNPPQAAEIINSPKKLWKYITDEVLRQGFYLGVKFNEPECNDFLAKNFGTSEIPRMGSSCVSKEVKINRKCY